MELRCKGKLHGIITVEGTGVIEFKCRSRWCGAGRNRVILHKFDVATGEYKTDRFTDPVPKKG